MSQFSRRLTKAELDTCYRWGARITKFVVADDDHGGWVFWLTCEGSGGRQDFGGVFDSEEQRDSFVGHLLGCFQVADLEELVGRKVLVLKAFPYNNEVIEGLEVVSSGKRFTKYGWRRQIKLPGSGRNPLEQKQFDVTARMLQLERQLREVKAELADLEEDFRDWG